jgi:vancomycin resistance protein YoaR
MKLEKNVKAPERKTIVKHIQHRADGVRNGSKVRVRGHKINHEKLSRWVKENVMEPVSTSTNSPSREISCETSLTTLSAISTTKLHQYIHSVYL